MTYSVGGTIQATDYNGFVSTTVGANINATLGQAGTNTSGYGQGNITTVSVAGTVTATQWATLNAAITQMASHSATAITSRTSPSAGNVIAVLSAVNTDITNCYNNRNNAVSSGTQYKTWSGSAAKTSGTGSGTSAWTITWTQTMTFANATAFYNFFNSGGVVKWQTSKTSTGTESDDEWNAMANTQGGVIYVTGAAASKTIASVAYTGTTRSGGSATATTLATATGAYALITSNTTLFKFFSPTSPYTGQFIQLDARVDNASTPTVITFTTVWTDPGGGAAGTTDNITGGTDTTSPLGSFGTAPATVLSYFPPETTYLTNTWGTPTIASSVA